MLKKVRRYINKLSNETFEERYVDYIINVQESDILEEMDFIQKHNKIDILDIDRYIEAEFVERFMRV